MEDSINQKQRDELWKIHVTQREKFIYYLLALAVTALGFSVSVTDKETIHLRLIPLGIAAIGWIISIYLGLMSIIIGMQFMRTNIGLLWIKEGINPNNGKKIPSEEILIAYEATVKIMEEHSNKMASNFNWQRWSFFFGVIFFMVWRIFEMSYKYLPGWLQ